MEVRRDTRKGVADSRFSNSSLPHPWVHFLFFRLYERSYLAYLNVHFWKSHGFATQTVGKYVDMQVGRVED